MSTTTNPPRVITNHTPREVDEATRPRDMIVPEALKLPVEKLSIETGQVLQRFQSGLEAQKTVSQSPQLYAFYNSLVGKNKGKPHVFKDFFWRFEGSSHCPGGCPCCADYVEKNPPVTNLQWQKNPTRYTPVEKICVQTGRILQRFDTAEQAHRSVSNDRLFGNFRRILTGQARAQKHQYKGFFWRVAGSNILPPSITAATAKPDNSDAQPLETSSPATKEQSRSDDTVTPLKRGPGRSRKTPTLPSPAQVPIKPNGNQLTKVGASDLEKHNSAGQRPVSSSLATKKRSRSNEPSTPSKRGPGRPRTTSTLPSPSKVLVKQNRNQLTKVGAGKVSSSPATKKRSRSNEPATPSKRGPGRPRTTPTLPTPAQVPGKPNRNQLTKVGADNVAKHNSAGQRPASSSRAIMKQSRSNEPATPSKRGPGRPRKTSTLPSPSQVQVTKVGAGNVEKGKAFTSRRSSRL